MTDLKDIFESSRFGVCVVDLHGGTLYQNQSCHDVCKFANGAPCSGEKGQCVFTSLTPDVLPDHGVKVFNGVELNGSFYDVVVLHDEPNLFRFLYPLDAKLKSADSLIKNHGLTRRELEIASLLVAGLNNQQIGAKLKISRNTLRTHLKNLYRKLPESARRLLPERESTEVGSNNR
jgi:hypothetical protein